MFCHTAAQRKPLKPEVNIATAPLQVTGFGICPRDWSLIDTVQYILVEFLECYMYKIMSSANNYNLLSFLTQIPFVACFCFVVLARNPQHLLNECGDCGHPCVLLGLGEQVSCFPISCTANIWMGMSGFHYVEICPS